MKIAYLDTFAGISGDMMVVALLHLGVSLDTLREEMGKLPFDDYYLTQTERIRSGICATQFRVEVNESPTERSFAIIKHMLQHSALIPQVKTIALRIFTALAEAEGRVHGVSPEEVHFHEVGAVDSIVDIVGTAFGLHTLGIEHVYVSTMPMGAGMVPSRHGVLPIPGPATVELLQGFHVQFGGSDTELVTPTGAAIVAALAQHAPMPPLRLLAVGYGAGERTLPDRPNLLRVLVGSRDEGLQTYPDSPTPIDKQDGSLESDKREHTHGQEATHEYSHHLS
jgi:pyridinium-3,5-bisthiocarboxylic acid mononucleotide nickel chelatase